MRLLSCLVVLVSAVVAAQPARGPFERFVGGADVAVSRDAHGVWIYWSAADYRLVYPGDLAPLRSVDPGPDPFRVQLLVACRADGISSGFASAQAIRTLFILPHHPEWDDVPTFLMPRYVWRVITGAAERHFPVTLDVSGFEVPASLVQRRVSYGDPRPDLNVIVDPSALLPTLRSRSPFEVSFAAVGYDVRMAFAWPMAVGDAVDVALAVCPLP